MVFLGHYGSGKTELALHFALKNAEHGKKTTLVDIDIVNPYFRSAEYKTMLEANGITLIAAPYVNTGIDLPIVGGNVMNAFDGDADCVIFDVGGDSVGATALGRYWQSFGRKDIDLSVYFVVNTKRPFTENAQDTILMIRQIENASRLKVSGLVHNSNLSTETSQQEIIEGQPIVREISRELGIPVAFTTGIKEILEKARETIVLDGEVEYIQPFTRLL